MPTLSRTDLRNVIICQLWVCVDCMLTHANGECGDDPEREPLNLIAPDENVAMGVLEHSDGCEAETDNNIECDCATNSFSWQSCEGCGSGPGGERHALVLFRMSQADVRLRSRAMLGHARTARQDGHHGEALAYLTVAAQWRAIAHQRADETAADARRVAMWDARRTAV